MSKTTCPITIRFRDTDTMGHVNNAVYLSYFELARMDYFDKMMNSRWDWTKDGIILARNEIDYLAPVFLLDKIYVETEVVHVGKERCTHSLPWTACCRPDIQPDIPLKHPDPSANLRLP